MLLLTSVIDGGGSTSSSGGSGIPISDITPEISALGLFTLSYPLVLALSYGIARSTSAGINELKNAIFATVAHTAIHDVSKDIFVHLHSLDLQFHLDRNTGVLSRVIDRGSRSINFVLNAMLFNVIPTIIEVCLVSGILAYTLGYAYAAVAVATIAAYIIFTVMVSNWRVDIRKHMNKQEALASGLCDICDM